MKTHVPVTILVLVVSATMSCSLFEHKETESYEYEIFLPDEYNRDYAATFPTIIFLHGGGGLTYSDDQIARYGASHEDFPFIVVRPKADHGNWSVKPLDRAINHVQANYRVDADRLYLTGLSRGGFATWGMAIDYPDRFAAISPICGGGDIHSVCRIKDVPVWVFHNEGDPTVPLFYSQEMVDQLLDCGGHVRFTIYPTNGHDAWTATYNNPEFYEWLLSNVRSPHTGRSVDFQSDSHER